jgi:CheY-like chemotaxis protein
LAARDVSPLLLISCYMLSTIEVLPQKLHEYLESLAKQKVTGTLHVTTDSTSQKKSYIFVWKHGEITYSGREISSVGDFVRGTIQKFKPDIVNVVLNFISNRITEPDSIRHHLELLVSIKIFTWEQIEEAIRVQTLMVLEEILPSQTQVVLEPIVKCDISYGDNCHGFSWSQLQLGLANRQTEWQKLSRLVPSPHAIPSIVKDKLSSITDRKVLQHIKEWVNGQRTIAEIATLLNKDSLQIARTYSHWVNSGWIGFKDSNDNNFASIGLNLPAVEKTLPNILSVDDSPVIQTAIKRALANNYKTTFVNDGKSALAILEKQKFDLILLDVTMPDMDGLELCKIIRGMSKEFISLPIIMLTARDKFSDKFKGYAAGSTDYLTKPFDAGDLNRVIEKYLS